MDPAPSLLTHDCTLVVPPSRPDDGWTTRLPGRIVAMDGDGIGLEPALGLVVWTERDGGIAEPCVGTPMFKGRLVFWSDVATDEFYDLHNRPSPRSVWDIQKMSMSDAEVRKKWANNYVDLAEWLRRGSAPTSTSMSLAQRRNGRPPGSVR